MSVIGKKKDKVLLEIIGNNSESVTGSCTKVTYNDSTLLFELGMTQDGKTIKENYDLNKKLIRQIKGDVKYIFIGHCHSDHCSNIPSYFKNATTTIIAPEGSSEILKEMWLDSAFINQRESEYLTKKFDRVYESLYTEDEVFKALNNIKEYPFHEIIKLDDEVSFRFSHAGHILLSAQTELYISGGSHTRKILFTSDIGNKKLDKTKVFVEDFEPVAKSNIVIGEATYAAKNRSMTKKDLQIDLDKIKTVIQQYCVDNNNIVVAPCFSLDRMPYMLWLIYSIFGRDENFKVPIVIDSPLSIRLLNVYSKILQGEAKEKFDEMMSWKNIKLSYTPEDSKALMSDGKAKCVLCSSGMLQAGRSVKWVQHILPNSNDCILFIGFATTNTLAHKIKNGKQQKTITINGKVVKNKSQIVDLHSFSSHMQRDDMLNYYSNINCEKIYLVHSNQKDKIEFAQDLKEEISKKCKTTKVIAVNRSTKISI